MPKRVDNRIWWNCATGEATDRTTGQSVEKYLVVVVSEGRSLEVILSEKGCVSQTNLSRIGYTKTRVKEGQ